MAAINAAAVAAVLTLDTSQFTGALTASQLQLERFAHSGATGLAALRNFGNMLSNVGGTLTKTVSLPLAAAATASVNAFSTLEDGVTKVMTIADSGVLSASQVAAGIQREMQITGQAPTVLTDALYDMISATGDSEHALGNLDVAAKLAKGGFTDAATAVNGLTTMTNVYGQTGPEAMRRVADMMLMTQNFGKTTVGELASGIGNVAATAQAAGMTQESLFASLAALTKGGLQTSNAITGLKAAISNVVKPSGEAAEMAEKLGLDFSVSALQAKGFGGFLEDVAAATGGNTEQMAQLFGSVEALNAMLILTSEQGAANYREGLSAMQESAGSTESAFEAMSGTLSGSLDRLKQSTLAVAQQFGGEMAPAVKTVLDTLTGMVQGVGAMDDGMRRTVLTLGTVAVAAGPVMSILGRMLALVTPVSAAAGAAALALAVLGSAWNALERQSGTGVLQSVVEAARATDEVQMRAKRVADISLGVQVGGVDTTGIESAYDEIVRALTDGLADTNEVVEQIRTQLQTEFDGLQQQINDSTQQKIDALDPQSSTYAADVAAIKQQASEAISALEALESSSVAWIESMAGKSTQYVQQHASELYGMRDAALQVASDLDAALGRRGETARTLVKTGATTDTATIDTAFGLALKEYNERIAAAQQEYADVIQQAQSVWAEGAIDEGQYRRLEEEAKAGLSQTSEGIVAWYAQELDALQNGLNQAAAGEDVNLAARLTEMVGNWGELAGEDFTPRLREMLTAALDPDGFQGIDIDSMIAEMLSGSEEGSMIADKIEQVLRDMAMQLEEKAGDPKNYELATSTLATNLEAGIYDAFEGLDISAGTGQLTALTGQIADTLSPEAHSAGEEAGRQLGEGFEAGVNSQQGAAASAGGSLKSSAVSGTSGGYGSMHSAGANTGQGYAEGLRSKISTVRAAARALAVASYSALAAYNEIRSPARRYRRAGQYTGQGYALGIEDTKQLVQDAMLRTIVPTHTTLNQMTNNQTVSNQQNQSISITINGSVRSEEDVRRLSRQLAQQIRAASVC